jgi:hypothetical protein
MSVTDRFLTELGTLSSGQVPKDHDLRCEYLLKGLQHIQIKVRAMSRLVGPGTDAGVGLAT